MCRVQKLIFTNSKGQSVELGNSAPYILSTVDGLGDVVATNQTQKAPYQDGTTYIDTVMEERFITLQVGIVTNGNISNDRQSFASVFNPKWGEGTLRYINNDSVKEIKAVPDHVPIFPSGSENRTKNLQITIVSLLCTNPFWQGVTPQNFKLEDFIANFRFSFRFPVHFSTRGDTKELINKGDVPTPIKVTFKGDAVNPKITKVDTGEFIKVNRTIPSDYQLVLNTAFGNKEVKIVAPDGVEENAFHYIDLDSTFFLLDVGSNKVSFITEGGKPEVYVEYKNMYLSV